MFLSRTSADIWSRHNINKSSYSSIVLPRLLHAFPLLVLWVGHNRERQNQVERQAMPSTLLYQDEENKSINMDHVNGAFSLEDKDEEMNNNAMNETSLRVVNNSVSAPRHVERATKNQDCEDSSLTPPSTGQQQRPTTSYLETMMHLFKGNVGTLNEWRGGEKESARFSCHLLIHGIHSPPPPTPKKKKLTQYK